MLLSQPLISAFQFHCGERNTVNVQGWILKYEKLLLVLLAWLICSMISGGRSCLLCLRAGSRCIFCCSSKMQARLLQELMKVTAAFVSGSLWSVLPLFTYLFTPFSSCSLWLESEFVGVLWKNSFLIRNFVLLNLMIVWSSSEGCLFVLVNLPNCSRRHDPAGLDKQMKSEAHMLTWWHSADFVIK